MTMHESLPGTKRLVSTWLVLIGLTVLSMWSAQLDDVDKLSSLPVWSVAIVLITSGLKAQQILMIYLNLRVSSSGWKGGFICVLAGTLLLVFAGYYVAR